MSDDAMTKPTIETILERINALAQELANFRQEFANFRREQQQASTEMRADIERGFRRLEHKIELQNRSLSDLYADHKELESRVDTLEKKPA